MASVVDLRREIEALPRIGALSTMPTRAASLALALPRILPQIDRLYLFLDGFDKAPPLAGDRKIVLCRTSEFGMVGHAARHLVPSLHPGRYVFLTFDDDILYPRRYAFALVRALARHRGLALVGYHAARLRPPCRSYVRDRKVFHFRHGLLLDRPVHILGAGTLAYLSDRFRPDPAGWPERDMDDLMIAIQAERQHVLRFAVRRRRGFITPIAEDQPDSIWARTRQDDSRHAPHLAELGRICGVIEA
jgi:hypothetical protein